MDFGIALPTAADANAQYDLFSDHVLAFELTSVLLVIAVVATVMLARKPTLPWMAGALNPAMPFSSTKPRMVSTPSSSSLAQTTKTSAKGELDIQVLVPERR